jgi:DNA invertase Pin-like site-specific DNA recombinase
MVRKINKSRPTEMRLEISDATPHNVSEPSRTKRRKNMLVGYARTSTSDQTAGLDAQQRDLKAAGCERVFSEKVSSVSARAKLAECLGFLRQGDVLIVTKPDRLARSTAELLTIEADLSKRGVHLIVLSMGGERLDTRNPKAEGRYKGRKPTVALQVDVIRKLRADGLGPAMIARQLGVARSSIYRMLETPA